MMRKDSDLCRVEVSGQSGLQLPCILFLVVVGGMHKRPVPFSGLAFFVFGMYVPPLGGEMILKLNSCSIRMFHPLARIGSWPCALFSARDAL